MPRLLHLVCQDPKVDLKVQMGDGPATPTAGHAGWQTVARPGRKGLTDFTGTEPFQQDIPVLLDGYRKGNSVQGQLDTILSLGGDAVFRAYGPIHRPGIHYVFGAEPDFGEVIRGDDGTLLRQRLTLKLKEYVRPDTIEKHRRRRRRAGIAQARAVAYTTRAGDTLAQIAARQYGDWRRWKEIGRKNGISDPNRVLPAGRELRL